MKKLIITIALLFSISFLMYSQAIRKTENLKEQPNYFIPKNHDTNFKNLKKISSKSFYDSKSEWRHIIDSTWGQGVPLSQKLLIYKTYAQKIHNEFDGFSSLNLNWDSLYNFYLNKITDSTTAGAFSSIISHFAFTFNDFHTSAYDSAVVLTPLNPGVPILLFGSAISIEHFGAVTTILEDSTTLVLRTVPNHPLDLQPGDIILGYEGIPWKILIKELYDAYLPIVAWTGGCKTAATYNNLFGAGLNWHLFNTIDILKYSTGDTLHLSVLPLLNLDNSPMFNNEQLPIPNIPFPNVVDAGIIYHHVQCVTYGKMENTNIGYIYLAEEWPENTADAQFYEAIDSLKNTDALIIDMRLNYGGWALFKNAFEILFNKSSLTIEDAYRCNSNTFNLCPSGDGNLFQIIVTNTELYDRPIAILLGPNCVSMGDLIAHRFRYHPMVKYFGASPDASLGDNIVIHNFSGWKLHYSISDMFHKSEPGNYLNRKEFPIDFPVWFNKDNVAMGRDDVVEKALGWINNLVYGHDLTKNTGYCHPSIDTLKISALVENPNSNQTSSKVYIKNISGSFIDSVELKKTGLSGESEIWSGNYIAPDIEDFFNISLCATDSSESKTWVTDNITKFTTVGPLTIDSIESIKYSDTLYAVKPFIKNGSTDHTINTIKVKLTCDDPWITKVTPELKTCPNLQPGQIASTSGTGQYGLYFNSTAFPGYFNLKFEIMSDGWTYWTDTVQLFVPIDGIDNETVQPLTFNLEQNYPNPFNPTTKIKYSISNTRSPLPGGARGGLVTLKVYDVLGREVTTLINETKQAGNYEVEFNAATLPSGVYFYQLKAGEFIQTKKMILLK